MFFDSSNLSVMKNQHFWRSTHQPEEHVRNKSRDVATSTFEKRAGRWGLNIPCN